MRQLLIGSGRTPLRRFREPVFAKDWGVLTRLDIEADHEPDVVHDLNVYPWPFADDTFDELHAYHILEHLGQQGDARAFFATFSEMWRVLKNGGLVGAVVPSWQSQWAWGDPSHTRVITVGSLGFLSQEEYTKQVGVTAMSDYRSMYSADFKILAAHDDENEMYFALRAVKPSRIQRKVRA